FLDSKAKLDEATKRDDAKSRPSNGQNGTQSSLSSNSNSSGTNGGKSGSSNSQVGAGPLSSGSPPAANASGAQHNYSNNNTLNPRSRDSCSYSATIDGKWSCDSAMQEIDSNNQRSQMTMMMGTMMTQSLGSAAQATAAGAKDQATILKAAAGTQASTAAMQGIIAMQNLYGAHQLGKQATERDLNIARLKSVGKAHLNTVDIGLANGGAVTNGTLTNNHAGFISAESGSTADKIITNFQLNSHVTMTEVKQGNQNDPSWAIRKQEIEEHKKATEQHLQTVSEEAIQEQTRIKRQLNGAKMMQYMMGFQQAATAAASGMAAKQLFDAANKKPEVRGAGPVVIADSGRSGDGTPGTGSGRGPSAISGGGEGQNAADADTNSDAPPSDLGTPFAPVPGGNELADQPPPPQEKPGGQGGGNGGGGGGSGGLSASTSTASEGGDQGPGDAKMAAASTDLTYSGGG
ncbi:hypothetical protein EBS43_11915, partial [bacterium]|nr:hypothetical protein [bacterium]